MGLSNIYARLAIQFGNNTLFSIENIHPNGCKIIMSGDYLKEGETL